MAEWSIAAVLKTVEPRGSGGSNPSFSAINAGNQQIAKQTPNFTPKNVELGVLYIINDKHVFTTVLLAHSKKTEHSLKTDLGTTNREHTQY